jgi:hypothetical protein
MVLDKLGKKYSENLKAQFSRAEQRDTIAKKFILASYAYSKWYSNRLFIEVGAENKMRPAGSLSDDSLLYKKFLERVIDVWALIKFQIKGVTRIEKHEFDLKIIEMFKMDTPTQRVADIFNTLNSWVARVCPMEDSAYWSAQME